jgi:hypothetical protein
VLDVSDDLPPIVLEGELIELDSLIGDETVVLLPCRGAGIRLEGKETHYLDERILNEHRSQHLVATAHDVQHEPEHAEAVQDAEDAAANPFNVAANAERFFLALLGAGNVAVQRRDRRVDQPGHGELLAAVQVEASVDRA